MLYFKFFIPDYELDTKGMSLRQHGAYFALLRLAYHTEHPLTTNRKRLYGLLHVTTKADRAAVEWCLNQFFFENEFGFVQRRVLREIEGYQKLVERNRLNAKNAGRKSKAEIQSLMGIGATAPVTGTADDDFENPVGSPVHDPKESSGFPADGANGHPEENPLDSNWISQTESIYLTTYKNIGQDLGENGQQTPKKRLAKGRRFDGNADDQTDAGATP